MKNLNRLDYKNFTVFVDSFTHPRSSNTHQHEDILSYVLYRGALPVLVDSGRASYADNHYINSSYHSGFSDPVWPVRPKPRFFFSHALLKQVNLTADIGEHKASFAAKNHVLSINKYLNISEASGGLCFNEKMESGKAQLDARLFHIFADVGVEKIGDDTLLHKASGCRFTYHNAAEIVLQECNRATEYGKEVPALKAVVSSRSPLQTEWSVVYAC